MEYNVELEVAWSFLSYDAWMFAVLTKFIPCIGGNYKD